MAKKSIKKSTAVKVLKEESTNSIQFEKVKVSKKDVVNLIVEEKVEELQQRRIALNKNAAPLKRAYERFFAKRADALLEDVSNFIDSRKQQIQDLVEFNGKIEFRVDHNSYYENNVNPVYEDEQIGKRVNVILYTQRTNAPVGFSQHKGQAGKYFLMQIDILFSKLPKFEAIHNELIAAHTLHQENENEICRLANEINDTIASKSKIEAQIVKSELLKTKDGTALLSKAKTLLTQQSKTFLINEK